MKNAIFLSKFIFRKMKNENPNLKLICISVIYTLFTVFMWTLSKSEDSTSLVYLFTVVIIWIILTTLMGIIIWKDKTKIKNWNLLILIFYTPVPVIFFLSAKEQVTGTWEYHKNNHRIKEIQYENKKKYFSRIAITKEQFAIPAYDAYSLDSINNNFGNLETIKPIQYE